MTVVANASPLICFARTAQLRILGDLFGEVRVPPRVADEAFRDVPSRPGAAAFAAVEGVWLRVEPPLDEGLVADLVSEVDAGEAEEIALAVQHRTVLLIDDLAGRRSAHARGVLITGSGGVVLAARQRGLIGHVAPVLDALVREGLRLSPHVYRQLLMDAGELAT